MAAYAEGLQRPAHAERRAPGDRPVDAETTPLRDPEHYRYDFPLPTSRRSGDAAASSRRGCSISRRRRCATPDLDDVRRSRVRLGRGTLDVARRDRKLDAGARAHRCAVPAVQRAGEKTIFANRVLSAMRAQFGGHVEGGRGNGSGAERSGALRRAGALRRHRRPRLPADLPRAPRDGASGNLDVPVIGVARDRVEHGTPARSGSATSLEDHGGVDEAVFDEARGPSPLRRRRLQDARRSDRLRAALGDAQRPLHYLAIPSDLFATVVQHLAQSGCALNGARVVVEKPFGRDCGRRRS